VQPSPHGPPVLVADDNPVMQTVIQFMLTSWGYQSVPAVDGAAAWEILRGPAAPPLAIVDWEMPRVNGVELCRRVRTAGREPYTYILLVSARSQAKDLIHAMDAGADDYVRKPFDAQELRVRLHAGNRIIQLHRQLVEAREALRDQATRDSLTGLLNHACILEALSQALAHAATAGEPVALLLADLDRFHMINESFGHQAGDEVLRELARRLRAHAPPGAAIGRYGGEEFLMVLPNCGLQAARDYADRIRDAVCATAFSAGAASFPVSCSVGLAGCEGPHHCDAAALLRQADESLFWAKRAPAVSA
jgi:two-component system, cell cycle response regulator